jgi:hypothetical protein
LLTKSQAPRFLHRAEAGDDDGDDVGITRDRRLDHGGAVDPGQPEVGHDDVESEVREVSESGFARLGLLDLVAAVAELLRNRLPQRRLVFDQQQMFQRIRHLARRQYSDT